MKCLKRYILTGILLFNSLTALPSTRLYFGTSGELGPDSLSIPVFLETDPSVAGIQFELEDDSAIVRIDSVVLADEIGDFTALTNGERVLIYHKQGRSILAGNQKLADLLLTVDRQITGSDTLRFTTEVVLADTLAQGIDSVQVETGVLVFDPETGIHDPFVQAPSEFRLYQNYPNPFNDETVIKFDLPQAGRVSLALYNINGELVLSLINRYYNSGSYHINLDMHGLPSGIYFYRFQSTEYNFTRKLLLLK